MNHGLSENQIQIIKDILKKSARNIEKVCLFGSRAEGNYQKHSDIDIVIYGDIDETVEDRLWTYFYESLLPYKVDIRVYKHIQHAPLRNQIDKSEKLLFTKQELYQ